MTKHGWYAVSVICAIIAIVAVNIAIALPDNSTGETLLAVDAIIAACAAGLFAMFGAEAD